MSKALPANLEQIEVNLKILTNQRTRASLLGIAILILVFFGGTLVSLEANAGSFGRGIANFFNYPKDLFVDTFEMGWRYWPRVIKYIPELITTLNIALFSTSIGFVLAVIFAIFSSRNLIRNKRVIQFTKFLMDVTRSFPTLIIAMVFLYLMGKSSLPAVIAITIHTAGALGKLFTEAIENCDGKPIEGLSSVGATWTQKIRFSVLPQVLPLFLSYGILRLEINVRESTILGFVGAGGIGEMLAALIQWNYGADVLACMFLLVGTIIALDYLSAYWRHKLIGVNQ